MSEVEQSTVNARTMFDLSGKVAWITGAGRGLGRALAVGLAEAGARVAITSRNEDELREVVESLDGREALVVPGNVADAGAVRGIVGGIADQFGRVDVLVNMAGISPTVRPSEEVSDDEWARVLEVNLSGTFYCCREAGRLMLEKGSGSIVNVSSVHGSTGVARMAAYGASKGGVENLTRSLAIEWATGGVRVNCIAPGYIETDLTRRYLRSRFGDDVRASIPLGQPGRTADLVGAAVYLASDASSYVTGAVLPIDGGWTAR